MSMQETEFIWMSGKLVPWHEARVHVLSHVLHYGTGAFEGIRAYDSPSGPAILGLDAHVERLFRSCSALYMPLPWSREEVRSAILETVKANGLGSCYIRPLAFLGYHGLGVMPAEDHPVELSIAAFPWGAYHGAEGLETGVDVAVSSWRRMAPDTHPAMVKASGNYVNSMLVVREAKRHGYAEGIVLDSDGYVCEGSGENLFVIYEGKLMTPPVGQSILPGITRGYVIQLAADQGMETCEQIISREMLYAADEIFMTGTAAEITPVRSVDRIAIGHGSRGETTRKLQEDFFGILHGEAPDRHDWLTPVNS